MHLLNKLVENLLVTPVTKVLGGTDTTLGGDSVIQIQTKHGYHLIIPDTMTQSN